MHKHVDSLRKDQQRRLKEWQDEVNQLEAVKVTVENDYDLEGPPRYLKYINKYYPSEVSLCWLLALGRDLFPLFRTAHTNF